MRMEKRRIGMACLAMMLTLALFPIPALAARYESVGLLRYDKTRAISAKLSISGDVATCKGYVQPSGKQSCSVTVTLYLEGR